MAKSTLLKFISIYIFLFTANAFADTEQCPHYTTSDCVQWMQLGTGDRAWYNENSRYWNFSGHIKPYRQLIDLKLKLLGYNDSWMNWKYDVDDVLHIINDKGQEDFLPTHLVQAYKQKDYSYFRGYLVDREIDRVIFDAYMGSTSYRVNLTSKSYLHPVTGKLWHQTFITLIDGAGSVRNVDY